MKDFIGRTECSEDIVKGLIEFFCDNEKHHKKGITGKQSVKILNLLFMNKSKNQ